MKSKELIRQLLEADPSGEIEVQGTHGAILCVDKLPGYYDGTVEYFEPSHNYPEKMFVTDKMDSKIIIREISIEEFLLEYLEHKEESKRIVYDLRRNK